MIAHSRLLPLTTTVLLIVGTIAVTDIIARAADRPNIIYLMTDDQRADALGCMNNAIIETPNIDALAKRGVIFDNAFTTTAICMTSRACVFTGQYAARHGIWDFNIDLTPQQLQETYLGQLKSAGYRTGFIGKWGVGHPKSADDILDFNQGFPGQSRYFEGDVKLKQGRHLTAKLGDQAIDFLQGCKPDQPFHLSISFKAPHCQDSRDTHSDQFPADRAYSRLYENITIPVPPSGASVYHDRMPDFIKNSMNRDRWAVRFRSPARYQQSVKDYYRLLTGVDTVVGRIRTRLAELGLAENTIIIYTSDHGFFLGEYGFAGKWTPHDISIRVPLVIFDPRLDSAQQGQRRDEMALLIDMAPTILEYAGIPAPERMQGRGLKSLVSGQPPHTWRTEFFYEHWFTANGEIVPSEAVRNQRWKYNRYLVPGKEDAGDSRWEELFDLQTDPQETVNLAADPRFANQLKALQESWKNWRQEVK